MRVVQAIGLVVLLSCGVCPLCAAQETAIPSSQSESVSLDSLQRSITALSDGDPVRRATARDDLLALAPGDLPTLRTAVEKLRPLAPGDAEALREIVTHVYLKGQNADGNRATGFMGVMMRNYEIIYGESDESGDAQPLGVVVDNRLPGFAAYRALHDGDLITAIGVEAAPEMRVNQSEQITAFIGRLPAGSVVHLRVLRQGRPIEQTITLDARPAQLSAGQPIVSPDVYRQEQQAKARAYWAANFASLVDDALS